MFSQQALNNVVAHCIGKQSLKSALATAQKVENPSRKAAAILKVAVAQAKAGDNKAAAALAAQIDLSTRSELRIALKDRNDRFDFRRPQSWGENYDAGDGFTMASHRMSVERTAEVAAAAMELAQLLEYKPAQSYADLFNEINSEEVIQALGRSHARYGVSNEAVAWAKQIGSGDTIPEKDGDHVRRLVERRIHALIGVAEGMLDRAKLP